MPKQQIILDRIKRVTALDVISPIEKSAFTSLSEVNIPFLSSQIKDQIGIRVRLTPVKIRWPLKTAIVADQYTRHFTVYLDSDAHRVLAVISRLAERSPDIHEPTAAVAEGHLRRCNELYLSFPSVDPQVTFMRALEAIPEGISQAQEIDGVYVMYSHIGETPQPVWAITLRGSPPRTSSYNLPVLPKGMVLKESPIWMRNFMRYVVDATTGRLLLSANTPQPE